MDNAEDIIDEVAGIIRQPAVTESMILTMLNRGQRVIASRILLPGLVTSNELTTSTSTYEIDLPDNFHRELLSCAVSETGAGVPVVGNETILSGEIGRPVSTASGSLLGVCLVAGKMVYQNVPAEATAITIRYYRLPEDMENSSLSFPDGISAHAGALFDAYVQALIYYACWKFNERTELGLEGGKPDTAYFKQMFDEELTRMLLETDNEGTPRRPVSVAKINWTADSIDGRSRGEVRYGG